MDESLPPRNEALEPAGAGDPEGAPATTSEPKYNKNLSLSPEDHLDYLTDQRADEPEGLRQRIVDALRTVFDPEIPINIFDLGLIYAVEIEEDNFVYVTMTLTSPACPVAGSLPIEVEQKVRDVEGVKGARVELTWEPAWSLQSMTEAARLELGMM